jgi:hypothetical protein
MERRLRFADLKARNIVRNRATLRNWILRYDFPPGRLTGPNTRTWGENEVDEFIASRPTEPKPMPQPKRRPGRARKCEQAVQS